MKENIKFPRILVISNNCFSKTNSNGRTLGNFFAGWPKDRLAQFYIQNEIPDFDVCEQFFRVTDSEAMRALLKKCNGGEIVYNEETKGVKQNAAATSNKRRRDALTMTARNIIWKTGRWKSCGFDLWVERFNPQAVLLQAGDNSFMFSLARKTAQKYNIPLFIYNSEGYYFKDFDYFRAKGMAHMFYPLFRAEFCREFRKTQKRTAYNFYLCDGLKNSYDSEFNTPSIALYTSSDIAPLEETPEHKGFTVSYLGNLGIGRHEGLVQIANVLQEISSNYFLDVYGKIPNEEVKSAFDNCKGIRYKGFVSYDGVIDVMKNSDLLVHTESFSDFYKEDLKFAFSTKIADSLTSGKCFLLYAPETIESYRYLEENELAYTVNSNDKLIETLQLLSSDNVARSRYKENAIKAAKEKHSLKKNKEVFVNIISQTVGETDEGTAD